MKLISSSFQIYMPSGTYVVVKDGKRRTSQFLNVWLHASPMDFNRTEGMGVSQQTHTVNPLLFAMTLFHDLLEINWFAATIIHDHILHTHLF